MTAAHDVGLDSPAARRLFDEIRTLHVLAGKPSSRAIATGVGGMSHTTVIQVLNRRRVPSWPVLSKIVGELGGKEEDFRILWVATKDSGASVSEMPSPASACKKEISVLVSYAHIDDKATYGRVRKFVEDVGNAYESMTGRDVGLFLDHDSIEPGEDWKDRIKLGLSFSSVFLAFISPAYLRSVNCNQEFSEYLHFLEANSSNRLIIPLLFTDQGRLEQQFEGNSLWQTTSKLHRVDVSQLRFAEPGNSEWLQNVQRVAERIEEVLAGVAREDSEIYINDDTVNVVVEPSNTLLEQMEKFEKSVPETEQRMQQLVDLFGHFVRDIAGAAPLMNRATTTKKKLTIYRQLAKRLLPTVDELNATVERLRDMMGTWDGTIKAALSFARRNPGWIEGSEDGQGFISSIADLANSGIEAFAHMDDARVGIGQGIGLSAALDEPLQKTQDALLRLADLRGMFAGWLEAVETIKT